MGFFFFKPILIYYSRKYYFEKQDCNLYLELPSISFVGVIAVLIISEIVIALTHYGGQGIGTIYPIIMDIYLIGIIILSLIISYYINKNK